MAIVRVTTTYPYAMICTLLVNTVEYTDTRGKSPEDALRHAKLVAEKVETYLVSELKIQMLYHIPTVHLL